MRNLSLEAAIWYFFTSNEFYEAAARECEGIVEWFGSLAVSRHVAGFGRNGQIYDVFKKRANGFRRGSELARLGDYKLVWSMAGSIRGDMRGIMDQPLHSWMTNEEYYEFDNVRVSRLMRYARNMESALANAMVTDDAFFNPTPEYSGRNNDDDGYPGDSIVEAYEDYVVSDMSSSNVKINEPISDYVIDRSISCRTGDEVPWTGVWYPGTGLENHSLTFAIKGLRMQPAFRVIKTTDELSAEGHPAFLPETVAVATTWHPVVPRARQEESQHELRAKAGQPCPKAGIWQQVDADAGQRRHQAGETMANLGSAYGLTVWRWISD
jgi:hypothetical protein